MLETSIGHIDMKLYLYIHVHILIHMSMNINSLKHKVSISIYRVPWNFEMNLFPGNAYLLYIYIYMGLSLVPWVPRVRRAAAPKAKFIQALRMASCGFPMALT